MKRNQQNNQQTTLQQMQVINRKLDGFGAKIRKAVPYILGASAYTAWAVPAVIKYNFARDAYLTETYMSMCEEAKTKSLQQVYSNMLQIHRLDDFEINYSTGSIHNNPALEQLRSSNPELYSKFMSDYYGNDALDMFAQQRGFQDGYDFIMNYVNVRCPNVSPHNPDGAKAASDVITTNRAELEEYNAIVTDVMDYRKDFAIYRNERELLSQGIDMDAALNKEVDFNIKDPTVANNLDRLGVDTTVSANDLQSELSDSPLDLSTLQLDDAIEIGIAGALVAVGTACISSKVMELFGKGGKGREVLSKGAGKIKSSVQGALDTLKNMSAKGANDLADVYNGIEQGMQNSTANTQSNDQEMQR